MNRKSGLMPVLLLLTVGAVVLAFTVGLCAQVQTTKTVTEEQATKQVKVERAEVVTVSGNDLVVKMEDGRIQHFPNIPESARVTVGGKQLGIHDLQPGMKLERTITTTATPKVITTTQTVTGKVWSVNPPTSVILTLENGENQAFKIPKGQKFMIDGQEMDAWGLKKGMKVSATKIVEEPITVFEESRRVSGTMPPPPPAPAADVPILIASAAPKPAAPVVAAEKAPQTLPKTGSELPLFALLGSLSLLGSACTRFFRKIVG